MKALLSALILCLSASLALAQETSTPSSSDGETLQEAGTSSSADQTLQEDSAASSSTEDENPAQENATPSSEDENVSDQLFPVNNTQAEVEIGAIYVRETYADWSVRCVREEDPNVENCAIFQLLATDPENPIAEVTVVALPEGGQAKAGITIVTPLGTLLTSGLRLSVDGGNERQYPFSWCEERGCVARFGLTEEELIAFKRGNLAKVTIDAVATPRETIPLTMSLSGFTTAYEMLKKPE